MRLIDAVELVRDIDIAFKGIKASDEEFERFRDLCGLIWMQPTVDPVKHGRWFGTVCSACGESFSEYYDCKFCPHCGAMMDGEDDEID